VSSFFGMRYVLLLFALALIFTYYETPALEVNFFSRFIITFSLIQIPFCIVERLLLMFGGFYQSSFSADAVTGTFNSYSALVFVQLFAFGIAFIYWLRNRKSIVGKNFVFLSLLIITPLFLSNSRASFIFLVAIIILIAAFYSRLFLRRIGIIIILAGLIFMGVTLIFGYFQKKDYYRNLKQQYSIEHIIHYINRIEESHDRRLGRMGRLKSISFSYDLVERNITTTLFGLGSGTTQQSKLLGSEGRLYKKYYGLQFTANQIALTLSELGILGILAYVFLFMGLWVSVVRLCRSLDTESALFHEALFLKDIFFVLLIVTVFLSFYGFPFFNISSIAIYAYFFAVVNALFYRKIKGRQ